MSIAITPLTQVSNLLVTLNSSVNFIIYIIYGEKFQRLFLLLFCKRHQSRESQILRRYTTNSTFQGGKRNNPNQQLESNGKEKEIPLRRMRSGGQKEEEIQQQVLVVQQHEDPDAIVHCAIGKRSALHIYESDV